MASAAALQSLPHGGVDRNSASASTGGGGACRSLTGAWIETFPTGACMSSRKCRSLTGAWIETWTVHDRDRDMWSLPHGGVDRNAFESGTTEEISGRSLTGAWIETGALCMLRHPISCRSLTGAWIETPRLHCACTARTSLPHGGVDRNRDEAMAVWTGVGRSLTGAWIETDHQSRAACAKTCRSLTGAWIETCRAHGPTTRSPSLPHGGVDRNDGDADERRHGLAVAPSRGRG